MILIVYIYNKRTKMSERKDIVRTVRADTSTVSASHDMFLSQLLESVPVVINERLYEIYLDACDFVEQYQGELSGEEKQRYILRVFQQLLGEIKNWDNERVAEESEHLNATIPWLRDVLRQMLAARVSILMSVRDDRLTQNNFQFVMPSNEKITHMFYTRVAKRIRGKAALYRNDLDESEREYNTLEAQDLIKSVLERSIPALVPLEEVVQTHLIEGRHHDEEELEVEVEPEPEPEQEPEDTPQEEEEEEDKNENLSVSDDAVSSSVNEEANEMSVPIVPEDEPADPTIAQTTIMEGDDGKSAKLKTKMRELREKLDTLKSRRKMVPRRQTAVIKAIDEEITYRETQLNRVRRKLQH